MSVGMALIKFWLTPWRRSTGTTSSASVRLRVSPGVSGDAVGVGQPAQGDEPVHEDDADMDGAGRFGKAKVGHCVDDFYFDQSWICGSFVSRMV